MSKIDINDAFITLHNQILECYKVICPIKTKTITFKGQTETWINATIEHKILKRLNSYHFYMR